MGGIGSIVLSSEIPSGDRSFIAEMLNRTHGRKWRCGEDGKVEIEDGEAAQASQFVALSKVLDATELGLLVKIKMGVEEIESSDADCGDNWHRLEGASAPNDQVTAQSSPALCEVGSITSSVQSVSPNNVGCCGLKAILQRAGIL